MSDSNVIILTDKETLVLRELTSGVIDNDSVSANECFINEELHMTIDEFKETADKLNDKLLSLLN